MLLKIVGVIAVKEIFDFVYLACRGIFEDNRKRWALVGCGSFLTLVVYFIFRAVGFKHPVICTALTSGPWVVIYDIIRK